MPQLSTDSWVIFVRSPVATYFRISRLVNTNHLTQAVGSFCTFRGMPKRSYFFPVTFDFTKKAFFDAAQEQCS